ncbi:GNAT family N-acetyltransferase [Pseudomonas sp. KU26590]|uniref:GNAT family N-acetyltransferase n=1 Tax=Pseudomonas sp. KU26590 TaxID=2991051 RepID=UPI00223E1EE4|nr:GNAT family N-acetyltransferase [Pseudomonas sp. KU26590]UZJ61863.1 GNAT family N-acetyltransferase [Pseudomonas sp. KU26590]
MANSDKLDFTLRTATPSDVLSIAALGIQVFMDTYATEGVRDAIAREALESFAPETICAMIERPDSIFLLAEADEHLVGFAQICLKTLHPLVSDPYAAELKRLYVQERFAGHGVGWQLLRRAENEASARGTSTLWVTVWARNARALQFYPRQGYENTGLAVHRLQAESHPNVFFCKSLNPSGPVQPVV